MGSSSGWFAHRRRRWRVVPALLLGGWLGLALPEAAGALDNAAPRVVTPRGELLAQEKATVDIFERSKGSVVFISTQEQVVDFWTRNVFSVPSGSGSGLIWDAAGHVITNFHVIQGATAARVKLADGRDYRATLVGDVIVAIDGKPVDSVDGLFAQLDDYKVGATIRMVVVRGSARVELSVALQSGA